MSYKLTPLQAFNAMQEFLEIYFKKTSSDSIAALLSCMQFLEDDETADPALWENWLKLTHHNKLLSSTQAFDTMRLFLKHYYRNSLDVTVKSLLADINCSTDDTISDAQTELLWVKCIDKVMADLEGTKHYMHLTK
jgi:hypothetical protein